MSDKAGFDLRDVGNVLEAVRESIRTAEHLTKEDEGAVALALAFASSIQSKLDDGAGEKLMYGPYTSLGKLLNDLGLTPQGRVSLGLAEDAPEEDEEF